MGASPVVLMRKKDGKIRVCVDLHWLNAVTVADMYPILRIDESRIKWDLCSSLKS